MIEPVALKDFFVTFFSSALIIMAGASYALLFAWSKINQKRWLRVGAFGAYAILLVAVYFLTKAANFSGYWLLISWIMVIGYFFAPIGIWLLCVKTHAHTDTTLEDKQ